MEIRIIEQAENYITMEAGKKTMQILIGPTYVNVLCKNAAHVAYRGMGRFFDSFEDALNNYKSPEAKAAINHAKEVLA